MISIFKGVIILFTLSVSSITLNEPVFIDFYIHNRLSESILFDLGHNRKSNFEFTITDSNGSTIHLPKLSEEGFGLLGKISLAPVEEYNQKILVNEWYRFVELGNYKIEIRLDTPIITESGKAVEVKSSNPLLLCIQPRDSEQLNKICQDLYQIAIDLSNIKRANEAALILSHICDPITVVYLEKGLSLGKLSWQYAIPGLARIANAEAIEVLVSIIKKQDPESGSALAQFVLLELKEKTTDTALKEEIEKALKNK